MGHCRESARTLRLFVAVYPPNELVAAMHARLAELELPRHRLTPREQVHLTLQFIGDVSEYELSETLDCVRKSTEGIGRAELQPVRLIGLPRRGRTRLVAAETDAPLSLLELQRRLAASLEPGTRRGGHFLPHLTLCRFRKPAKMPRVDVPLSLPSFPVQDVRLMQSILRPEGAEHSELARFDLTDDRAGPTERGG